MLNLWKEALEYWVDAAQRNVLFFDVLRQRSNAHLAHENDEAPTMLYFKWEMVLDGRKFTHPVNFHLLRIFPPDGVATDPKKRPFIVFDPRAGQGPGIGGMKDDSEIGRTLKAGHPCYFVGFLPKPVLGQTVEHVCEAEAIFIERVIEFHPEAEKPCLIGNCQAGWQIAITASIHPELVGVLILAGAPLSYWAGARGKNPTRYTGGVFGGAWLVSFQSDMGNGLFDGAELVDGFEKLDPANTYWKKGYNLYTKVDTEASRFLEFERWWGNPMLLDKNEIQFITEELFVGNRLSGARLRTSDGLRIDLRNIKSPILIFCSQGDDITPPQQALNWVTDLYRTDAEIITAGQTIIYCLHADIGHLGIFVSSSVANKEHDKFIQNIDMIETLPPGLYEAVFMKKTESTEHAGLATGDHVLRFEARTLQDIKKIGINTPEDDLCFRAAKRASENILSLYENYISPWVRIIANEEIAKLNRENHPVRLRYKMFSDHNPVLSGIGPFADAVRGSRAVVSQENFFWNIQESAAQRIVAILDAYRDMQTFCTEKLFFGIYGSKFLQATLGLRRADPYSKFASRDLDRDRDIQRRLRGILGKSAEGGLPEALARALLYVVRGGGGFDEREFKMFKQLCDVSTLLPKISQSGFKSLLRMQHEILVLDEKVAMEAISRLLDNASEAAVQEALSAIHTVIKASGDFTAEEIRRLQELERYFVPSHSTPRRRATDVEIFGKDPD